MTAYFKQITICLAAVVAFGTAAQTETNAYQFLNVSPSSHVYGLGGHNIALIDDDINLIEQNPALLGPEIDNQVGLNYMRYIGGSNFMGARYGMGINEHCAWAAGLQYYGYGSMTATEIDGSVSGTFTARDLAVNATFSHDITDNLRGGINVKFAHSKYESYSSAAIAADLGINYYNPENELSLSLVVKNLGGEVKKFGDKRASVPWDIQIGYSQLLRSVPFRFSVTAYNLRYWHLPYYEPQDKSNASSDLIKRDKFMSNLFRHLVFAAEYVPNERIYIGLGYNYKTRTDMSNYKRNFISGLSIAAGLRVKAFGFGIALAQPHTGATTFMVNLNASLAQLLH
ncbi:MAG: type IX secretion system protein PorQ [Muribaculaceae bacterium]|nr:type IX secretion system protein PorQ [Muribaculaceae bacterium]